MLNHLKLDLFALYNELYHNGWDSGWKQQRHNVCAHAFNLMGTNLFSKWQHVIVFLFATPFQLEQIAPFWPETQGCWAFTAFDLYIPVFRIYTVYAMHLSTPRTVWLSFIQFEWSYFHVRGHASVSLGRDDKDKRVPFSLHNLSESVFSCLGARTEVPVYPRERERVLAVGLPRQQGTVQAWCWKKRGSGLIGITGDARGHLCAYKILHTPFWGEKGDFFFVPN